PPPSYPSLQTLSANQVQPYYIPQPIHQTPAPCVVQTITFHRYTFNSIFDSCTVRYGPSLWALAEKETETDTCPPSSVNCDGKRDCSQGSDESRCVRFGTANELQVMTSKTKSFLPVCAQGWDKNIADQTCQQLGFRESYEVGVLDTSSSAFQSLNSQFTNTIQASVNTRVWKATRIEDHGGSAAAEGQWPWQASLHFQGSHSCGGTLVAPDFIITAAHCFPKGTPGSQLPSNWRVYIGLVSQLQLLSPYNVKQIILHENYDPATKNNDIALLKLSKPASNIQPVCLPVFGQTFPAAKQCWTTGFGVTKQGAGISTLLMEVAVNLIDSAVCNSFTVYGGRITENMQCAGDLKGERDSCQGDSGGPLVCKVDDKWYLTGVTSWGDGCGNPNRPGVYSDVGQLLMWIYGKIAHSDKHFCSKYIYI
uniref:Transmembrane serine protease 13b n=2 Tax=Cyprinus carpio TaxID=7962 RepID=A0A8C1C9A8_CYPCA